jgi:hypothetical protein
MASVLAVPAAGRARAAGAAARTREALVLFAAASALACLHAARFLPFLTDDALISLRYARRLLDGAGLTWTDGERVEGYTNLLWVLGVAAVGALGIDLVDAARLLGFTCTVAVQGAIAWRHAQSADSSSRF